MIEALILAKVIMIGAVFRLGRGFEHKPLIYPTLYKTVVFTLFVAVFTLAEHMAKGLWQGKGLTGGIVEYFGNGPHEFLAGSLMIFVAFHPVFRLQGDGAGAGRGKNKGALLPENGHGSCCRSKSQYSVKSGRPAELQATSRRLG